MRVSRGHLFDQIAYTENSKCGAEKMRVINSRNYDGNQTWRRYECRICNNRTTTHETREQSFNKLVESKRILDDLAEFLRQ